MHLSLFPHYSIGQPCYQSDFSTSPYLNRRTPLSLFNVLKVVARAGGAPGGHQLASRIAEEKVTTFGREKDYHARIMFRQHLQGGCQELVCAISQGVERQLAGDQESFQGKWRRVRMCLAMKQQVAFLRQATGESIPTSLESIIIRSVVPERNAGSLSPNYLRNMPRYVVRTSNGWLQPAPRRELLHPTGEDSATGGFKEILLGVG